MSDKYETGMRFYNVIEMMIESKQRQRGSTRTKQLKMEAK